MFSVRPGNPERLRAKGDGSIVLLCRRWRPEAMMDFPSLGHQERPDYLDWFDRLREQLPAGYQKIGTCHERQLRSWECVDHRPHPWCSW